MLRFRSDDRSAATVTDRIQNAIDAGSGLRSRGKPICVVIDEIDGAAGGGDTVSRLFVWLGVPVLISIDSTEFHQEFDQADPGCSSQ